MEMSVYGRTLGELEACGARVAIIYRVPRSDLQV